jgi:hypothetical protein
MYLIPWISLAFFAISNNVVILALRGMIAEFLFFIVIAAICFSGLLFTLWDLGKISSITWNASNERNSQPEEPGLSKTPHG